jgi:hypothetical protein
LEPPYGATAQLGYVDIDRPLAISSHLGATKWTPTALFWFFVLLSMIIEEFNPTQLSKYSLLTRSILVQTVELTAITRLFHARITNHDDITAFQELTNSGWSSHAIVIAQNWVNKKINFVGRRTSRSSKKILEAND